MYEHWGGSTLPHELMAANAEAAPAGVKRGGKKSSEEQSGLGGGKEDRQKRLCSTWNKCETRGKCQWELDNEGEKCRYAHFLVLLQVQEAKSCQPPETLLQEGGGRGNRLKVWSGVPCSGILLQTSRA